MRAAVGMVAAPALLVAHVALYILAAYAPGCLGPLAAVDRTLDAIERGRA